MKRIVIILFLSSLLPLMAQAQDWDPISGFMAIEGNLALIEVRAVDESRDKVLSTRFLWLESDPTDREPVTIFEPGVLAHEDHAQVRLQLQEGEHFSIDLLSREATVDSDDDDDPTLKVAVTITVERGSIEVHVHPVETHLLPQKPGLGLE